MSTQELIPGREGDRVTSIQTTTLSVSQGLLWALAEARDKASFLPSPGLFWFPLIRTQSSDSSLFYSAALQDSII